MKRNNSGFTLPEIMIVVAIVAILSAIALPAYTRYVLRSQRVEGKSLLNTVAQRQERFFSTYNRYSNNLTGAGVAGLGLVANCGGVGSETCLYTVAVATQNDGLQYTLTASPQGKQANDVCGALTLSGTGTKTFAGASTNGACW